MFFNSYPISFYEFLDSYLKSCFIATRCNFNVLTMLVYYCCNFYLNWPLAVSHISYFVFILVAGLILKANKKYSQELEKSFHLSHAALDTSVSDDQKVQVMYVQDGDAYLLCTLQKDKVEQFPLDLNFSEGSKVCFSIKGNGIVHLSGFLIPEEEDFDDFGEEEESENETAKIGEASE